ncbi:hypothetical protein [Pseudonocardia sp. ICBG601]|uniref:hypothetical protein n=1 Tax=Pseudonocardia sp. ICBG601 TaxID=2846759 RepID=UPI001CF648F0|nr:hypothetical protein [Pseudonocardia sp. ICBG601]
MSTERHGHVLLIRMTRPDKRNAVDAAMTRPASTRRSTHLDDDPDLWCGVLAGDPTAFSAGTMTWPPGPAAPPRAAATTASSGGTGGAP